MQRRIIRCMGMVVSMVGAVFGTARGDTPTTTPTTPTEPAVMCKMIGGTSSSTAGCHPVSGELPHASGDFYYQTYECDDGGPKNTYIGSGTSSYLLGKYANPCNQSLSAGGVFINKDDFCSLGLSEFTTGRCEGTTLHCYDAEPFRQAGCCEVSGTGVCVPTNDCFWSVGYSGGHTDYRYYFTQCGSGYYKAGSLSNQHATDVDSLASLYDGCCLPCSGIAVESGTVVTTVSHGTNSGSGFYWMADQSSYGITSCTAYPSGGNFYLTSTDDSGTYEINIKDQCPYNN